MMLNRRRQTPAYDSRYKGWRGPQLESMTISETGADTESMVSPNYTSRFLTPIIHLMYGPEGNSYLCFPEGPNVSRDEGEGNIKTRGSTANVRVIFVEL